MSSENPVCVVAGILIEGGRILLTQRKGTSSIPYAWNCPGGKVEPGENLPEALIREWREEIQCQIDVAEYVFHTRVDPPDVRRPVEVHHFLVRNSIPGQRSVAVEDIGIGWFSPQELLGLTCSASLEHWKSHVIRLMQGDKPPPSPLKNKPEK